MEFIPSYDRTMGGDGDGDGSSNNKTIFFYLGEK